MDYVKGGITAKTGEPVMVRIPQQGAPSEPVKPAEPAKPKPKDQPPSDKRLRVSSWMDHPMSAWVQWISIKEGKYKEDHSRLEASKGVLDDISFITTVWMSANKGVTWKVDSLKPFLQKSIDLCHANKIQFIAGYTIGDEGTLVGTRSKIFVDWITNPVSPTPEQHAADILEFFEKENAKIDGVGFDLELNGLKAEHADNMTRFYHALADLLAPRGGLVTIATGIGTKGHEDKCLGTFRAQPFRIAKGKPNIIIRPMAYDMFNLSDAQFDQWHADIVDYALNTVGLDPGQFQLGIKTIKNAESQDPKMKGANKPAGWSETKCTLQSPQVVERCKTLFKPNNVGMINFAGWSDFAAYNSALNAGKPPAGTVGHPLQVPLAQEIA
jgi:hypothetical protein